jgi:hypothetical protein
MLQSLDLANGDRIVMVDKNGIKIADSDINEKSPLSNQTMQQSSFTILQSLKNDINGNTGTLRNTRRLQSNRILQVHKSNSDQWGNSLKAL